MKYQRVVAAPKFLGIEMKSKSSDTRQVQVWFYPSRLDRCDLEPGAKWIINYPDILDKWLIKLETNLSQSKIMALQLGGFVLDDGIPLKSSSLAIVVKIVVSKDLIVATSIGSEDCGNAAFAPSKIPSKFNLGLFGSSMISFQNQMELVLDVISVLHYGMVGQFDLCRVRRLTT